MSTTGRTDGEVADAAEAVATAIREAELVRLVATADGDALAAAGLLTAACSALAVPYHIGFAGSCARVTDLITAADEQTTTVTLGAANPIGVALDGSDTAGHAPSTAHAAYRTAQQLGTDPDPITALAGGIAAGVPPDVGTAEVAFEDARERGLDQRPGLASPVSDPIDGLVHSTLVHGTFSDDPETTNDLLGSTVEHETSDDENEGRRLASLVAIAATEDAPERAAGALDRVLNPYVFDGPFRTLGGHADVLTALADRDPGLGIAGALGTDIREPALDAWRNHATAVHAGIREAETERYSGLLVARVRDAPVVTVARRLRNFRSPEPTVLVLDARTGAVAIAGESRAVGDALTAALPDRAVDRGRIAYALEDVTERLDTDDLIAAIQETVSQ